MGNLKKACIIAAGLAMAVVAAACGSKGNESTINADNTGSPTSTAERRIENFFYEFNSDETGHCSYSVTPATPNKDNESVLVSIASRTNPELNREANKPVSLLDDLEKLVKDNDLEDWDGFDETGDGTVSGYSFELSISYENGESIDAAGYESYPVNEEDYRKKHDAIIKLLEVSE